MNVKKIAIFLLPTVAAVAFLAAWGWTISRSGNREATDEKATVLGARIPDARLRELMGNPKTRLETAVQAGNQKMKSAVVLLVHYADTDPNPEVRAACVRAMGRIGDADCVQPVIKAGEDLDLAVRLAAIEAMGTLDDPAGESELVRQLRKEDPEVRRAAAAALAAYRTPDASSALAHCLSDQDTRVRVAAAAELGMRKDPSAREGLARAMGDEKTTVREAAAKGLARDTAECDWPALARAVLDNDKSVRKVALAAARQIGKPLAGELAKGFHVHVGLDARKDAATLLMELGGPETVPALVRCLDKVGDRPPKGAEDLRSEIVTYLKKLGVPALGALTKGGIDVRCDLFAKEAVAQVCVYLGQPAVGPIQQRILKWTLFPNAAELKLWVKTLGEIGDAGSAAALNRALAQDVSGIDKLVIEARKSIEGRTGAKLPAAKPDFGEVAEKNGFEINRRLPPERPLPKLEPGKLPPDACVLLSLKDSLLLPKDPSARRTLVVTLIREGGKWTETASGTSRGYNQGFHSGEVVKGDDRTIELEMVVNDDPWVMGGFGSYRIELDPGEELKGKFTGQYNYRPVSGEVTGDLLPLPPPPGASNTPPLESGEHPRLAFRKGELPAMRKRALTPIGKAIVRTIRDRVEGRGGTVTEDAGLDGAIGCGFLYVLFGDEAMGRRAVPALRATVKSPGGGHPHDKAYKLNSAAFAYDFAYDCLTEEENKEIGTYLAECQGIIVNSVGLTGNFNNGMASNWTAIGTGGPGLAALAMLREKGPITVHPPREQMPVYELAADAEAGPADGVPVHEYRSGEVLKQWLLLGPFDGAEGDPLAPLGGAEKARLSLGTKVQFQGNTMKCVPLPESSVVPSAAFATKPFKITLPAFSLGARSYLYSLLKVGQETGTNIDVSFPFGFQEAALWINGTKVVNGGNAILKPGLHRLLIEVKGPVVCPTFRDTDAYLRMGHYLRYVRQMKKFEIAKKRYEETGERQDIPIKAGHARNAMLSWWRNSIGDHGFGTEGGYPHAYDNLMPFTMAYENATGERIVPGTSLPWLYPLTMAFDSVSTHAAGKAGGRFGYTVVKSGPFGMLVHAFPPELMPAAMWKLSEDRLENTLQQMGCKELVFLFSGFPPDVAPQPPEKVMPKVIEDRRKGGYVFRKSYDRGADDFTASIFLRSEPSRGPCYFFPEGGSFCFAGLGTAWAMTMPGSKHDWQYAVQNVVLMPPTCGNGFGKKVYFESKSDGSGVLGADTSSMYRPLGANIKAMRHFAVDYSEASGTPALFVLVDRVHGGKGKTWVMHSGGSSNRIEGSTFTIAGQQPDTSLRGQLLTPDGIALSAGPVMWEEPNPAYKKFTSAAKSKNKPKMAGGDIEIQTEAPPEYIVLPGGTAATLKADTKEENADFFFVMTVQKGPAPKFEVEGRGLDAKVKVGKRIVRFDKEKNRLLIE
ncbi:MAG: HEAT repeat domain-containing protein [Thermoguttaceae bacterium]